MLEWYECQVCQIINSEMFERMWDVTKPNFETQNQSDSIKTHLLSTSSNAWYFYDLIQV